MEKRKINRGCMEANTLAIIDSSAEFYNHKDSQEAKDDRIDFLEAVRTTSIVPEHGTPPTKKMVEAVFQILKAGESLELIMSSYELLNEIENRFPRVYISESSGNGSRELVVVKEAWLPFVVSLDVMSSEKETKRRNPPGLFDPNGFHELLLGIAEMTYKTISQRLDTKFLGNMLLFQYLVNVLEGDFVPRINMYKESLNWNFLRECLLNMLLVSRRINYKVLMKDCLFTICSLCQDYAGNRNESDCSKTSIEKSPENHNTDVAIALLEVQRTTCMAMQKFMIMIMELDESKQQASMLGQINRSDGARTQLVEIILDELTYYRKVLPQFLQVFNDPKRKLEIIVQYLLKYTSKPSVRTRRSNGSSEDSSFLGILKSFTEISSTKNIIKKLNVEVVQLLLAHAFLAYTSMSSQQPLSSMPNCNEAVIASSSLVEISKNVAAAFNSLRKADEKIQISSLGKEALFTAAMIISTS
ncbi:SUPPRESSOR OF NPR1-1, INDUCIBLE 1 [Hibiscus trionum]|uniref:SUPPRESSOR OF NPR1-1, INDUCIBLE 1 n=1 Tax=Hibiscus trionum TaxID=183268 RepID=A0A9W7IBR8_HIBTR|nr:SUPPRESSOR OF NPR1-1, INDUCIBLE 1 [Hibiscus trionum]